MRKPKLTGGLMQGMPDRSLNKATAASVKKYEDGKPHPDLLENILEVSTTSSDYGEQRLEGQERNPSGHRSPHKETPEGGQGKLEINAGVKLVVQFQREAE